MSDFAASIVSAVPFEETELDSGVDFVDSGDFGVVRVPGAGFGEDGFGEGPFGGPATFTLQAVVTVWTNVGTP